MVKQFEGSFLEVVEQIAPHLVETYRHNSNTDDALAIKKRTITHDVPRTALVDFSGATFSDFSNECLTDNVFREQYAQGNLTGGLVNKLYISNYVNTSSALYDDAKAKQLPPDADEFEQIEAYTMQQASNMRFLNFAYRDQDNHLCAFGLVFNQEHPETWLLQMDRDTTSSIQSRHTVVLASGDLIQTRSGDNADQNDLNKRIALAINNPMVNQLVSGLIDEHHQVSTDALQALQGRIKPGVNIDDRCAKKTQLVDVIKLTRTALTDMGHEDTADFEGFIKTLTANASTCPNFFREDLFEKTLQAISEQPTKAFEKQLVHFQTAINAMSIKSPEEVQLHLQANQVLQHIEAVMQQSRGTTEEPKARLDLGSILNACTKILSEPTNKSNLTRLASLSQGMAHKKSSIWKTLSHALSVFLTLTLIVATLGIALLVNNKTKHPINMSEDTDLNSEKKALAKSISNYKTALNQMTSDTDLTTKDVDFSKRPRP